MNKFRIQFTRKAAKQLDKIPDSDAGKILSLIASLANDPRPIASKKLKGRNSYRIRKGNYRIIYEIFESKLVIDIITIGHRRDVYR